MVTSVIRRKTAYRWYLRTNALYDEIDAVLDWRTLLPGQVGTKHQREYMLKSCKQFIDALIVAPHDSRGEILAHGTVLGWFRNLRRLVHWMVDRKIWRFSSISGLGLAEYMEDCHLVEDKSRPVSKFTSDGHMRLLQYLWELKAHYVGALKINPHRVAKPERKYSMPSTWRALDESVALPLIRDALDWINVHGQYLLDYIERRWALERQSVAISRSVRQTRIRQFYSQEEGREGYVRLQDALAATKGRAYFALRRALTITNGACFLLLLFLVGFRVRELTRLNSGCLRPEDDDDGVKRNRLHGVAAKSGGRERSWVACDEVALAVNFLDKCYSHGRKRSSIPALVVNWQTPDRSIKPGRVRRLRPSNVNKQIKSFAAAVSWKSAKVKHRLHPHVARKTFALFVVRRDKSALESLAHHFGHIHYAVTDWSYLGGDIELSKLLNEENRRDLSHALMDLLQAKQIGGMAGKKLHEFRSAAVPFRGRKVLSNTVDKLIKSGIVLAPCDWGYCVYSQSLSACQGDEKGPNSINRSPEVCSGCANFAITQKHRLWWESRMEQDEGFLRRSDASEQAIAWVQRRLSNTKQLLVALNEDAMSGRRK